MAAAAALTRFQLIGKKRHLTSHGQEIQHPAGSIKMLFLKDELAFPLTDASCLKPESL